MMNLANWGLAGSSTSSSTQQQKGILEEVMRNGNVPVAGKMGVGGGGVVPPALLDETRVPRFYLEAIAACGATSSHMLPHTALVYNLMVTSGLPRPVLSYIWSAVNRSLPGQLTRPEFFSCLALIALAQKGESLAALSEMSQLPIPFLQTVSAVPQSSMASGAQQMPSFRPPPQSTNAPVVPRQALSHASSMSTNQIPSPSAAQTASPSKSRFGPFPTAFIPTSLLPRREKSVPAQLPATPTPHQVPSSKSVDILSEVFSAASSSSNDSSQQPEPSYATSRSVLSSVDRTPSSSSALSSTEPSISKNVPSLVGTDGASKQKSINPQQLECWVRALCAACDIMEEAGALWAESKGISVLREVAETERGNAYLDALHKDYEIVQRLLTVAMGLLPPEVLTRADRAVQTWKRLSQLQHSHADTSADLEDSDGVNTGSECDVCNAAISRLALVEYGGRLYHAECANLWINRITPLLPNLHLC